MLRLLSRIPPLVLFLAVGALLFALDSWRDRYGYKAQHIEVAAAKIDRLERSLKKRYGRQPSRDELNAELKAYIDEELLYREALKLGLHQSDEIVRRRLAQTMAFIIEGKADLETPEDNPLRAFYDKQKTGSKVTARVDFRQLFFNSDRRKGRAEQDATKALEKLKLGEVAQAAIGDAFILGQNFRGYSEAKLVETFGREFADAIAETGPNQWAGPFSSMYGSHLVLIEGRTQVKAPGFEKQRAQLINAWRIQRRREIREQALDQLRQEYDIDYPLERLQKMDQL